MSADLPPHEDAAPPAVAAPAPDGSSEPLQRLLATGHVRALDLPDGARLWLLGTAHVSKVSVEEAHALVHAVRPDVVAIELCQARYTALTDPDRWKKLDIFQVFREGRALVLLANLAIGAWQRRIGAELGVEPGQEMLAAAQAAQATGARLALIDRDIQATLKRTWATISLWQRATLLGAIGESLVGGGEVSSDDIEAMKQGAQLQDMLGEFSRVLPEVAEPLIYERDRYMVSRLLEEASAPAAGARATSIVAVVGAAHTPGMATALGRPAVDRAALEVIPPRTWLWRALPWLVPAFVAAAMVLAWRTGSERLVGDLVWIWIVANFVPAALLTALVGGKPLSILAAGVASPITSLNPMVGAAMVVGPLEAWLRKPTVADCERIADDVQSLRGMIRNPFTRVLVVAMAASIGSALGAWIAGAWMVHSLASGG